MDKVIQIANLMPGKRFRNPQCGRVYSAKGISPTLNTCGGRQRTEILGNMQTEPKLRYTLGRTNAKGKGENHTLKFHTNPYYGCVTANRFTNRETWIAEIK